VLDIGCGPGRAAIHLQERGHDVLSIDLSPLAVKTARLCGVRRAQVRSVTQVNARLGRFDTLLMLGNNFGLMSSRARARWLLRRFAGVTPPSGRVVAEAVDPYLTDDPDHLRYHRTNRARGRMSGQIRMRVRYRRFRTPWFDYLLVSQKEMWGLVRGTAWTVERFIDGDGPAYVVVLEKRDVA
jgi:SAM-dependent methyltransferase